MFRTLRMPINARSLHKDALNYCQIKIYDMTETLKIVKDEYVTMTDEFLRNVFQLSRVLTMLKLPNQ